MVEILRVIGIIICILNGPWVDKVNQIKEQTKILRIYFNNHYGGKAVVNAMQFKETNGMSPSSEERKVLERARERISAK